MTHIWKTTVPHSGYNLSHFICGAIAPATQMIAQGPIRGHVRSPDNRQVLLDNIRWFRASKDTEVEYTTSSSISESSRSGT